MNLLHLRDLVIVPTLKHLGLHSEAAVELVLGTAIQESQGKYLKQLGGGPAIGIYQMEPDTHDDIWVNYLRYKPELAWKLRELELPNWYPDDNAREMEGNLYYATGICRTHYRRVSEPLPEVGDVEGMARYWKKHYNTCLGAGTEDEYRLNWLRYAPQQ